MPGAADLQEYLTPHFPPAGKAPIIYIMSSSSNGSDGDLPNPLLRLGLARRSELVTRYANTLAMLTLPAVQCVWRRGYDAFMRVTMQAVGAATICVLSACSSVPLPADSGSSMHPTACHGPYVADVDTSVPGEATPEGAALAWSETNSILRPSGAPQHGWKLVDDKTVRSGNWFVGVSRTLSGGWIVSGLSCGTP